MRMKQKSELLQIIDTLQQGISAIVTMLHKNQKENVINLLVNCQDAAISIGETIEKSEGEKNLTFFRFSPFKLKHSQIQIMVDPIEQPVLL